MSAIRLARAATGREKLLKFAGAYHGHVDGLLAEAGSGLATQGIPASPGVPAAAARADRRRALERPRGGRARAFAEHELAAVLAEPYPANMGLVPPAPGFLELLRELATEHGALLVFDEVITGFRVAPGGAQELTGVLPDLTVMGKVIGGGLPAAAFGGPVDADGADRAGRRRLPGRHAEREPAGGRRRPRDARSCSTRRPTCALVATTTHALADGLREAAGDRPVSGRLARTGLLTVFFAAEPRARLRGRRRLRHRGLRRLVPRAAGPRRLPAAVAVRGLVPVARPHARAHRAHASRPPPRRSPRSHERRARTRLADGAARGRRAARRRAAESRRRTAARRAPPRPAPRAAGRAATSYALLVEAIREGYLQHYGDGPRRAARAIPTSRCWPATACTRSGSARLAALGDLDAVAELADVISLCAQAHAEGDPARADAVWEAGRARGRAAVRPLTTRPPSAWRGAG